MPISIARFNPVAAIRAWRQGSGAKPGPPLPARAQTQAMAPDALAGCARQLQPLVRGHRFDLMANRRANAIMTSVDAELRRRKIEPGVFKTKLEARLGQSNTRQDLRRLLMGDPHINDVKDRTALRAKILVDFVETDWHAAQKTLNVGTAPFVRLTGEEQELWEEMQSLNPHLSSEGPADVTRTG